LIFVRLSETGPTLQEWMGEIYEKVRGWFDAGHARVSMTRRLDYPANWKIPVEISLESYHIPEVHPQTFGEDPGETLSEHWFHPRGSAFYTEFLAPRRIDRVLRHVERWLLKRLGDEYTGRYEHHHLFPNLTISHTDSLTLAQSIIPVSPQTSACLAIQAGVRPVRPGAIRNLMAAGWGRFTAWLTRQILNEDRAVYQEIQTGVQGGGRPGLLGRCEERLEAFQRHVRSRLDTEPPVHSTSIHSMPAHSTPRSSQCADADCRAAACQTSSETAPVLATNPGGES
jgi:phenylpropionate dioxygenase-like ring-hydroxylating dioxygenase large terminal subunit